MAEQANEPAGGPAGGEMDGIGATKKLLEKVRDKLSGNYS